MWYGNRYSNATRPAKSHPGPIVPMGPSQFWMSSVCNFAGMPADSALPPPARVQLPGHPDSADQPVGPQQQGCAHCCWGCSQRMPPRGLS